MIDTAKLPRRALVDSNVLMRAYGDQPDDPRSSSCVEFFSGMLENSVEVLVAAPTLAEVIRFRAAPPPRVAGIEIVAFDDYAAFLLGTVFPMSTIKGIAQPGVPRGYYKYDALIMATAIRWKAECVVTLDEGFNVLAVHASSAGYTIAVRGPSFFTKPSGPQMKLI